MLNKLFIFIIIFLWGCPIIFLLPNSELFIIVLLFLSIGFYGFTITNSILLIFSSLFLSFFYVWFRFESNQLIPYIGRCIIILISFIIVNGNKTFIRDFIKVMFIISFFSLFFFSVESYFEISDLFTTGFDKWEKHFIFHNFSRDYDFATDEIIFRNSSFFWEPGAFAAHILLAFYFVLFKKEHHNFTVLFFLFIALLSTKSTMGITVLIFLSTLYFIRNRNYIFIFIIGIVSFLLLIYFEKLFDLSYFKIYSQLYELQENNYQIDEGRNLYSSRFGNIFLLYDSFMASPFFGNGLLLEFKLRYVSWLFVDDLFIGIGNGFMDLLVSFGIVFFIVWLGVSFKSLLRYFGTSFESLFFLSMLMLIIFSEPIHNLPIFYCFTFLQNKNYKKKKNIHSLNPSIDRFKFYFIN